MFDASLPFGEVWGAVPECPSAKYFQRGKYFDGGMREITVAPQKQEGIEDRSDEVHPEAEDYRLWHWTKLKTTVKALGEPWVNKEAAVAFLEERDIKLMARRPPDDGLTEEQK